MLRARNIPDDVSQRRDGSQLGTRVTAQWMKEQDIDNPACEVCNQL
jgi:hypothetical protein